MTVPDVRRLVRRYLAGELDAAAVRLLLGAVRPVPGDPIAPLIAEVLNLLSNPTPVAERDQLLAALVADTE